MVGQTSESRFYQVDGQGVERLFVVENAALERLLFDRSLVGLPFRRVCFDASTAFFRHLRPQLEPLVGDLAELVILSKGLIYNLADAFGEVTGENLQTNLVAARRQTVKGGPKVKIAITYQSLEAATRNLVVGDTVASGTTIIRSLETYLDRYPLTRIFVVSFAGSTIGARAINAFCEARKIEATFLYGLASFGLAENGFDLAFLHPDTITREVYRDRARLLYGNRQLSAVGWDFGSQAHAVSKYRQLCWYEARRWGLADSTTVFPTMSSGAAVSIPDEVVAYSAGEKDWSLEQGG